MGKPRTPAPIPADHVLLTTSDVALWLRRAPDTIREWRYLGIGPPFIRDETSGGVWYLERDVIAWLDAQRVETTTDRSTDATV